MTINEFKAHIKFLDFEEVEIYYQAVFSNNYAEIIIIENMHAIRIDHLTNEKSLFVSLNNPNIIERIIHFDKLGTLLPKQLLKNKIK